MKVTIESQKGLKKNLKVFVDKNEIQQKITDKLVNLGKEVNLKGFRPGKIPMDVLKRQFGKAVYGEVLENILRETSSKAIEEKKIRIAGQPKLEIKSHGEGKDLNYSLEIDELPSIKLKSLEDIKFTDYEIKVTPDEIEKKVDEIAKSKDNFTEKNQNEISQKDDLVVFDYEATIEGKKFEGGEGKNTQIVLGKDLFIKGFDKQLIGVKKNQNKVVTVTLPENYLKKELAKKVADFNCKILNIKKPEPVKINDEFAKNLGAKDLTNLKEMVTKQIQYQYKSNLDFLSKENILNQIEKLHDVNLPDNLVKQEMDIMVQGLKKEDVEKNKKETEKLAKKRIKLGLILNEIGEKNKLKVEEEELRKEIQKQVQSMPGQQKKILEYYQKNPSLISSLRGSLYEEKIINLIKQKSKQSIKAISIREAKKLIDEHHKQNHNHADGHDQKESKKSKKAVKSTTKNKKIRNK